MTSSFRCLDRRAGYNVLIFQFAHFPLGYIIIELVVGLSCSDVGMAKDFLDDFQWDAVFNHARCSGVRQVVQACVYVAVVG